MLRSTAPRWIPFWGSFEFIFELYLQCSYSVNCYSMSADDQALLLLLPNLNHPHWRPKQCLTKAFIPIILDHREHIAIRWELCFSDCFIYMVLLDPENMPLWRNGAKKMALILVSVKEEFPCRQFREQSKIGVRNLQQYPGGGFQERRLECAIPLSGPVFLCVGWPAAHLEWSVWTWVGRAPPLTLWWRLLSVLVAWPLRALEMGMLWSSLLS